MNGMDDTEMQSKTRQLMAEAASSGVGAAVAEVFSGTARAEASPVVRFAVFLCHVLSLDRPSADSAMRLKRGLLRIVGVGEFAPEAEFSKPCVDVVRGVVCPLCGLCCDIDLLRDPNLVRHVWACRRCRGALDRDGVEAVLVQRVVDRAVAFSAQDVECAKCGAARADNAVRSCSACACHGVCCCDDNQRAALGFLRAHLVAARFHNFVLLQHTIAAFL